MPISDTSRDEDYLAIGQGRTGGRSLVEFRALHGAGCFYSWMGLDSPVELEVVLTALLGAG